MYGVVEEACERVKGKDRLCFKKKYLKLDSLH